MARYQAHPGKLPAVSIGTAGTTRLPSGRVIGAALWVSELPVKRIGKPWRELVRAYATTGLWPVVLVSDGGARDTRSWLEGVGHATPDVPDLGRDPAVVLAARWLSPITGGEPEALAFTGLALGTTDGFVPIHEHVDALAGRLGLVAAARPADVPEVIGWSGAVNHIGNHADVSAVLRSWEDRFGAYLVAMGFDTITLAIERPVKSHTHADLVAREHAAFCPDVVLYDRFADYRRRLVGATSWRLSWD